MLASRASRRCAQRLGRSFATVLDTSGLKVASVDANQPTSSITFLVKGGSRAETKPGIAHALKSFAFKGTAARSALGTVREAELYGGFLSASLSREYLALSAEFLRGDEEFFFDVLTSFVSSAKYTPHEWNEYVLPILEGDVQAANSDPTTRALETAHALAFRSGLGSSIFATSHPNFTTEDIRSYARSIFTRDNIAVLGTGIAQARLASLAGNSLGSIPASASTTASSASTYFGGETRLELFSGPQTVFVGFGTTGAPTPELAALAAYLSAEPAIKWSKGISPLATSLPEGSHVRPVYLPYSDASLFGFLVQGSTSGTVTEAAKAAVKTLKTAAATGGIKSEDLKKAVAKAKFSTASAAEGREGLISSLGAKVLAGSDGSLDTAISALDKVTAAGLTKSAASLLKVKPTFVAVGDVAALPYPDQIGL